MSVADQITRIKQAKSDLISTIQNKGVEVSTTATLDELPQIVEDNLEKSGGSSGETIYKVTYTGNADSEGLKELGWTDDDIAFFQKYGVDWDEEDDDKYKLKEWEKESMPLYDNTNNRRRFLVKRDFESTETFSNYYFLKGVPSFTYNSSNFNFSEDYQLKALPQIEMPNVTSINISNCNMLEKVTNLDTANVTSINISNCKNLKELPELYLPKVSSFTSNFTYNYSLQSMTFTDTSKLTSINSAFYGSSSLKKVIGLNLNNVKTMTAVFYNCYALEEVPDATLASVTSMVNTFYNCYALKRAPKITSTGLTSMGSAFYNCYSLTEIEDFDTSNVASISNAFYNCYSLQKVPTMDCTKLTSLSGLFYNCYSLIKAVFKNTSKVTNTGSMFYNCYSLQTIEGLDTSAVTNASYMFYYCKTLRNLPTMDLSQVRNTSYMFYYNYALPVIDISTLDSSIATTFGHMFDSVGMYCKQEEGAYADSLPYVYVKDEDAQNWVLNNTNGHPSTWSTANVVIAGSEADLRGE